MKHLIIISLLLLAGSVLANTPPEVTNAVAVQRPQTTTIDVTFDVYDVDGDHVDVSLWYSTDAGISWDFQCVSVSGDEGPGVVPASGLTVTWDAGIDFPDIASNEISIRVFADDGTGNESR
ncbi:MAG: hypothetical protein GY780_02410 [bacterium]|nr:hypothetical protein [bacterium]